MNNPEGISFILLFVSNELTFRKFDIISRSVLTLFWFRIKHNRNHYKLQVKNDKSNVQTNTKKTNP